MLTISNVCQAFFPNSDNRFSPWCFFPRIKSEIVAKFFAEKVADENADVEFFVVEEIQKKFGMFAREGLQFIGGEFLVIYFLAETAVQELGDHFGSVGRGF